MSFPRQHARTRRFTLGVPRAFAPAPDGRRVLYLRTPSGDDPVTSLWSLDTADGTERLLVDARRFGDEGDLPDAERARRERARETAGGITAYATDREVQLAAFALAGRLHTVRVDSARVVEHPVAGAVFDPRPDPTGRRVAVVVGDGLHLVELDAGDAPGSVRPLAVEDGAAWGRAEFIAAEEMGRGRGYWWSPDGDRLAVTRVVEDEVPEWYIADPANPGAPPVPHRYPAAGTVNADVGLAVIPVEGDHRVDVAWDREAFPYLARVSWGPGPLTLQVQSRDQRRSEILVVDPDTGATRCVRALEDDCWVEPVDGAPAWSGDRLVTVEDRLGHGPGGSRVLAIDGEPVTEPGVQVRGVVSATPGLITLTASVQDPTQVHVLHHEPPSGRTWSSTDGVPGVHGAARSAGVQVVRSATLPDVRPRVRVTRLDGAHAADADATVDLDVVSETPLVEPRPRFLRLGERELHGALLLPRDAGEGKLPVVLDPYGGPHAQRVLSAPGPYLTSQWLADQGFAVLVVDGRGSPGRGPAFERAVHRDLATPVLDDQVDALHAAAEVEPRLDLDRVALRGWSFGGYLAALAVLRRPDVFRAGVAGAPVTDWRLYDTHYTERYLGHPETDAEAYRISSLVDVDGELIDAVPAPPGRPEPQLLLIHGLADDNVVAAHALRLSGALLAAGRDHRFLPLSGVTHMTPQEVVAENLLTLQVAFLREALGAGPGGSWG